MDSSKQAVWPFIVLALLLGVLFWAGSGLLDWWQWQPAWLPALGGLLSLAAAAPLAVLSWWLRRRRLRNRPDEAELAQRQRRQLQQRQLLSAFEKAWRNKSRGGRSPYETPWFLLIDETLDADRPMLEQMGFEQVDAEDTGDLPVTIWVSDQAVLAALHLEEAPHGFDAALDLLLQRLNLRRPRQAANGVLLGQPLGELLGGDQDRLEQQARRRRALLQQLNRRLGLDLPVYCLLTGMGALEDFCQFFATFDEQQLEAPLGALMPVTRKKGYDPAWFADSFAALKAQLSAQVTPALKAQLNPDYRQAILAGPFQIGLLQAELEDWFRRLFLDHQFETRPLNFRGYFFVHGGGASAPVDRLGMLLAARLGIAEMPVTAPRDPGRSLFVKQLLRREIAAEAALVGVHRRRETAYRVLRVAVGGGLCLLFALFVWLLKTSHDHHRALDLEAVAELERYKQQLQTSRHHLDDLSSTIFSLSALRDLSRIHERPAPWYLPDWLPDPGIGRAVDGAYQQALEEVLLVGLRENLLKDLYVYNKLDDPVKSLELYNLYQQLSDPERTGIDALIDYYVESLQAEGEGDVATLERFRQLVRDLLKPGVVPPPSDDPLIELVKTSLASEDLGDLLYQHILQQPGFSRRVDLRDNLGPNHGQVLAFEPGYGGYLMPYIFTREGFQELMSGTRFQLAAEALKDYEELVGRISGETELGRINRKLRRRYIEDYVSHWQRFADSIRWVPAEGWGDTRQQLATAAEPLFSPLRRYYGLISRHTDLAALLAEPGAEADAARTPKLKGKTGSVAKKVQGPLDAQREAERSRQLEEQRQSALKMADAIAQPFVHYHRLIAPDDAGQSHLDLALRQVNQALEWVREATQGPNRGRFFLDQLAAPESLSPLAQMQSLGDAYSDPLLRDLLQGGAARLNELAMADVRALLNERWRSDVMAFYDNRIGPFYPFARQASQDVGLPAFREFFGPAGLAAVFGDSFLSYFSVRDSGDPVLDSFLPGRFLALDGRFWRAMTELERIRGAFFTADTPGLRFAIRADAMSPDLTEFSLRDEGPLYRYRNGPSLWAEMSWPVPESRSRDLEVKLSGNDHVVLNRRYPGLWNWFRLTESMQVSATADAATSQLVAAEGDSLVRLQLRVEGETNPFVEGFFTALDLPENL